nr:unnamed protein product [Callosobruchus analis]
MFFLGSFREIKRKVDLGDIITSSENVFVNNEYASLLFIAGYCSHSIKKFTSSCDLCKTIASNEEFSVHFGDSTSNQKIFKKLALVKAEDFIGQYPETCSRCDKPFKSIIIKIAHILTVGIIAEFTPMQLQIQERSTVAKYVEHYRKGPLDLTSHQRCDRHYGLMGRGERKTNSHLTFYFGWSTVKTKADKTMAALLKKVQWIILIEGEETAGASSTGLQYEKH